MALLALTVVALLAGCGNQGGSDPVSAPTQSPPPQSTPASTPPTESETDGATRRPPAFPQHPRSQTADSGRTSLVLTDVRVVEHERFDRVVLTFSGKGRPGWSVGYVDTATLEGSGDEVRLGGDAILDIYASGTTWPAPDYYDGPRRLRAESGGVTEVYLAGTFEGSTQVLAGIDGDRAPFRVFARTGPSRLVVDVRVDGGDGVE